MGRLSITIGKSHDNRCVFNNSSVSRHHAILELSDDKTSGKLRDLGSTNGTFVNGVRISEPRAVTAADTIQFGSEKTSINGILAQAGKTKIEKPLRNGITIGRADDNDIVISHDGISAHHAVIYKNEDGTVTIEDRDSTNGTYVNGEKITSKRLKAGDRVTLGKSRPLDWANIFPDPRPNPHPVQHHMRHRWLIIIAAASALIVFITAGAWFFLNRKWDKERVYDTYKDTVCLVIADYGYKVMVGDKDMTETLFGVPLITLDEEGEISKEPQAYTGTAFFISEDGKLATNLHITKPWLYENDSKEIAKRVKEYFALMGGAVDPRFNAMVSEVKVDGKLTSLYVIPNGLAVTDGNAIYCKVLKGEENTENDISIIQTESKTLPSRVTNVLSLENADMTEDALKQGKTIFTIGFPYGLGVGMIKGEELQNQVHEGAITQERGEYEFGHDAATAGGASGSPIINDKGQLIGIHHAGLTGVTGAQGFNRGIKAKHLYKLYYN